MRKRTSELARRQKQWQQERACIVWVCHVCGYGKRVCLCDVCYPCRPMMPPPSGTSRSLHAGQTNWKKRSSVLLAVGTGDHTGRDAHTHTHTHTQAHTCTHRRTRTFASLASLRTAGRSLPLRVSVCVCVRVCNCAVGRVRTKSQQVVGPLYLTQACIYPAREHHHL